MFRAIESLTIDLGYWLILPGLLVIALAVARISATRSSPNKRARPMPWFISYPIAALAIIAGLGLTWFVIIKPAYFSGRRTRGLLTNLQNLSADLGIATSVAIFAIPGAALVWWAFSYGYLREKRLGKRLCPKCLYDMQALPNTRTCPECGYFARTENAMSPYRRKRKWAALGIALIALALIAGSTAYVSKTRGLLNLPIPQWLFVRLLANFDLYGDQTDAIILNRRTLGTLSDKNLLWLIRNSRTNPAIRQSRHIAALVNSADPAIQNAALAHLDKLIASSDSQDTSQAYEALYSLLQTQPTLARHRIAQLADPARPNRLFVAEGLAALAATDDQRLMHLHASTDPQQILRLIMLQGFWFNPNPARIPTDLYLNLIKKLSPDYRAYAIARMLNECKDSPSFPDALANVLNTLSPIAHSDQTRTNIYLNSYIFSSSRVTPVPVDQETQALAPFLSVAFFKQPELFTMWGARITQSTSIPQPPHPLAVAWPTLSPRAKAVATSVINFHIKNNLNSDTNHLQPQVSPGLEDLLAKLLDLETDPAIRATLTDLLPKLNHLHPTSPPFAPPSDLPVLP